MQYLYGCLQERSKQNLPPNLLTAKKRNWPKTSKRTRQKNDFPYLPSLESNNQIRKNQKYPKRSHENAWPQKRPNTQLFIQLVNTESIDYHQATAKNIEEASKLVEAGFEYVCDYEGIKLFRKRKYHDKRMGTWFVVMGPLGFEPRIACAPGMYPNPC
jgi:hypothetical protein